MGVYIALSRGINVGGRNAVRMQALRALHCRIGHTDVQTYIQSGNVVFSATGTADALSRALETEFETQFGFPVRIAVVTSTRWRQIVEQNPFAKFAADNPKSVHVAVCDGRPNRKGLSELLTRTGGLEAFEIDDRVLYLHAPNGFGTSRFAAGMERASGVSLTVRNWRTVTALQQLIDGR